MPICLQLKEPYTKARMGLAAERLVECMHDICFRVLPFDDEGYEL